MSQPNENSQHWAKQSERGNAFFLNLTRLIVKYCPLWLIKIATFCGGLLFLSDCQKSAKQH